MALIQRISVIAVGATIASSTGAYVSYSYKDIHKEKQQEEAKPKGELVWANFEGKKIEEGLKLPKQPLDWF